MRLHHTIALSLFALWPSGCQFDDAPELGEDQEAATTQTYHLHAESSPSYGMYLLKAAVPDAAMVVKKWDYSRYAPVGQTYDTFTLNGWTSGLNVPGQTGVIYAGSTITFTMWMRKSNNYTTAYPGVGLNLNWWNDPPYHPTTVCGAVGTTEVTTTMKAHTFSCTVPVTIHLTASDRLWVTPFMRITGFPGRRTTTLEHAFEGTNAGTGDSRLVMPAAVPIDPTSTCPAADPTDQLPDDDALNACLAAGGVVRLARPATGPGYIINSGLVLATGTTTLISSSPDTRLIAGADLRAPMLRVADGVTGYSISNLTFDGNRLNRSNRADCADPLTRTSGYNLKLTGRNFRVESVTSENGLCGSSIEVSGDTADYTLKNNRVRNNGFLPVDGVAGGLSDGITLTNCDGAAVYNNTIEDNTDVDLRVGPFRDPLVSTGCKVDSNTIKHTARHGNAGAMIAGGGNHNSASLSANTITSTYDNLAFGILVGSHPFDPAVDTTHAGDVKNNTISGAVVLLAVDGIGTGTIDLNTLDVVQGHRGLNDCPFSARFTAADHGTAILQAGAVARDFHPGSCSPCGNGVVEAGETCDIALLNGIGTSCCSNACQLVAPATECTAGGTGVGGLWPAQTLLPDQSVASVSGRTTLIYQLDGNLVLYQTGGPPLWASNTFGEPGRVVFSGNGDLSVYDAAGSRQWHSNTTEYYGARLIIEENSEGIGDLVIYSGSGITPMWRASQASSPGSWSQNDIERAAWLAGQDSERGTTVIEVELARGRAEIESARTAGKPINIFMRGIDNADAGLYNDLNASSKAAIDRMFTDAQHIVVLGNDHDIWDSNKPQWGEALIAMALINYAHTAGVPIRVVTHSNGASSLGGTVEVAAQWGLLQSLGSVKKVAIIAPSATDVRLQHIFTAFTTRWNQDQTRIDVIYGIQDYALTLNRLFLGPGPAGVNLTTGIGSMVVEGAIVGYQFGSWLGAGIGAAIGFIVGLFVEGPAERAKEFLEDVEDNPWWFGGDVHVSFINQFYHDVNSYAVNSQLTAALAYSQCVTGSRECVADCTVTITPLGPYNQSGDLRWIDMDAAGGAVNLLIETPASCAWRASSWCLDPYADPLDPDPQTVLCPWASGASGTANGTAVITIDANGGSARNVDIQVDALDRFGQAGGPETHGHIWVDQAAAP